MGPESRVRKKGKRICEVSEGLKLGSEFEHLLRKCFPHPGTLKGVTWEEVKGTRANQKLP